MVKWSYRLLLCMTIVAALLALRPPQAAHAQAGLCVRTVNSPITVNGVVAPGTATGNCTSDAVWAGIGTAQFLPAGTPDGDLSVAFYDPTPNNVGNEDAHLFIGVDVKGDQDVSDFDIVSLFFDATNDDTWNNGDFVIQVKVSPESTPVTTNEMCNQNTGTVSYYQRSGGGWVSAPNAASLISVKHAFDYATLAQGGNDAETKIWNLEIDMPVRRTVNGTLFYGLTIDDTPYFSMGGYIFADYNHQQSPQQGTVLKWPGSIAATPSISQSDPTFSEPLPNQLADLSLADVCFDVNFSANPKWEINGSVANAYDNRLKAGQVNKFRVTYYFDGPGNTPSAIANPGDVDLRLTPYRATGAGTPWEKTVTVSGAPYNFNQARTVEFQFDFGDPSSGFASGVNFVCATGVLDGFDLDDNITNNSFNVNHNEFMTSDYTQEVEFVGDSIPDEGTESGMVFMQFEMSNELSGMATTPGASGAAAAVATDDDRSVPEKIRDIADEGSTEARIWLALVLIGVLTFLIAIAMLMWSRALGMRLRYVILGALAVILFIVGLIGLLPELDDEPGEGEPASGGTVGTDRFIVTNADELGLEPVEGLPGWYQMPLAQGETRTMKLQFTGQPLPYETEHYELEPASDGERNQLDIPVDPGSTITLVSFGEVDPDGDGELPPTSPTGMIQEFDPEQRFLMPAGYYVPSEYTGTLIGSFDGFSESFFVIGHSSSILVPEDTKMISVAVNAPLDWYQQIGGLYEIFVISTESPGVPTHGTNTGDATFLIPPSLPSFEVLTSLNLYTYYQVPTVDDGGELVAQTYYPLGEAHFSIFDSHAE